MVEKAKILITGSKGMLGKSLVSVLSPDFEVQGIDIGDCDITDKTEITKKIKHCNPHVVVHTAAYSDVDGSEMNPEKAFAVNVAGTENVTQAVKEVGAILFYISTDYVFDGKKDKPYKETDTANPINIYGQSKLKGEKIIQVLLKKYLILRTSWLFGPSGKNFVTTILQRAKERQTLQVVNDQRGSPTYTIDLASTLKKMLSLILTTQSPKPSYGIYPHTKSFGVGVYHITNSGSCSWYEFAREIILLKKLKTQILPVTSSKIKRPAQRPKMSVLDNSKLMNTFKLKLRPCKEALNDFLVNSAQMKEASKYQ